MKKSVILEEQKQKKKKNQNFILFFFFFLSSSLLRAKMQKYIFHLATVFGTGHAHFRFRNVLSCLLLPRLCYLPKALSPHHIHNNKIETKQNQKNIYKKWKWKEEKKKSYTLCSLNVGVHTPTSTTRSPRACSLRIIWSMKCEHDMILKIELIHDTPVCACAICIHVYRMHTNIHLLRCIHTAAA